MSSSKKKIYSHGLKLNIPHKEKRHFNTESQEPFFGLTSPMNVTESRSYTAEKVDALENMVYKLAKTSSKVEMSFQAHLRTIETYMSSTLSIFDARLRKLRKNIQLLDFMLQDVQCKLKKKPSSPFHTPINFAMTERLEKLELELHALRNSLTVKNNPLAPPSSPPASSTVGPNFEQKLKDVENNLNAQIRHMLENGVTKNVSVDTENKSTAKFKEDLTEIRLKCEAVELEVMAAKAEIDSLSRNVETQGNQMQNIENGVLELSATNLDREKMEDEMVLFQNSLKAEVMEVINNKLEKMEKEHQRVIDEIKMKQEKDESDLADFTQLEIEKIKETQVRLTESYSSLKEQTMNHEQEIDASILSDLQQKISTLTSSTEDKFRVLSESMGNLKKEMNNEAKFASLEEKISNLTSVQKEMMEKLESKAEVVEETQAQVQLPESTTPELRRLSENLKLSNLVQAIVENNTKYVDKHTSDLNSELRFLFSESTHEINEVIKQLSRQINATEAELQKELDAKVELLQAELDLNTQSVKKLLTKFESSL